MVPNTVCWALCFPLDTHCRFIFAVPFYRTSLPSSYTLLHYSAVWSGQCDAYCTLAVLTGWWWSSCQLHNNCQSRLYWSHHLFNQCLIASYTLQCHQHYQHSGMQTAMGAAVLSWRPSELVGCMCLLWSTWHRTFTYIHLRCHLSY